MTYVMRRLSIIACSLLMAGCATPSIANLPLRERTLDLWCHDEWDGAGRKHAECEDYYKRIRAANAKKDAAAKVREAEAEAEARAAAEKEAAMSERLAQINAIFKTHPRIGCLERAQFTYGVCTSYLKTRATITTVDPNQFGTNPMLRMNPQMRTYSGPEECERDFRVSSTTCQAYPSDSVAK